MFNLLKEGRKVLLLPDSKEIEKISVGGMFTPDYWNFSIRGYIQRTSVSLSAMQGVLASHMPQE